MAKIHDAIREGKTDSVRKILEIDPSLLNNTEDYLNSTPLMVAAYFVQIEILTDLILKKPKLYHLSRTQSNVLHYCVLGLSSRLDESEPSQYKAIVKRYQKTIKMIIAYEKEYCSNLYEEPKLCNTKKTYERTP